MLKEKIKKNQRKINQKEKIYQNGITLIALIITIIVLLILAGVTIAALSGPNGLITRAIEAKEKTEIARIEEAINLAYINNLDNAGFLKVDDFIEELENIDGVDSVEKVEETIVIKYMDLEKIIEINGNTGETEENLEDIADKLIEEQEGENWVIGLDSYGKEVNMDFWYYQYSDDRSGWNLNEGLNEEQMQTSSGYKEEYLKDGTIQGEIPAYIAKSENGVIKKGLVIGMVGAFANLSGLTTLPENIKFPVEVYTMDYIFYNSGIEKMPKVELPPYCLSMNGFFYDCTNLKELDSSFQIPDSCKYVLAFFRNCESLEALPDNLKLPSSVTDSLNGLFYNCQSLKEIPEGFRIPENNNITDLASMFDLCISLEKLPDNYIIPESVTNICYLLSRTASLKGNIYIEGNPTIYEGALAYTSYNYEKGEGANIYFSENCTNILQILATGQYTKIRAKQYIQAKTAGDNMTLYGELPSGIRNSNNWVIVVHGYTGAKEDVKFIADALYNNLGYNVLTPDLRGHGESNSKTTTLGVLEGKDLVDWANYIATINPNAKIVLYGFSMGAASVCMASGENLPSNVVGILEDSGYTSISDIKSHVESSSSVSQDFKNSFSNTLALMQQEYDNYDEIINTSFKDQVAKCRIPMLFLHGGADALVPVSHATELYNAATSASIKKLHISEGCGHTDGMYNDPEYLPGVTQVLNTLFQ